MKTALHAEKLLFLTQNPLMIGEEEVEIEVKTNQTKLKSTMT